MKREIKEIKFQDSELLGVKDENGQVWLGIRKTCRDIGLSDGQAKRQVENIQSELVFNSKWCKFATVQTEGNKDVERDVICIMEEYVTLWLAKISLTPTMQKDNPTAVQKLMNYQMEAQKVLHEAFTSTEEAKQKFYDSMGMEGEILNLKDQVNSMSEILKQTNDNIKVLLDSSTVNTRQQQELYKAAKDRINSLLGGAHSDRYKQSGRVYFSNIWISFRESFQVASYKDLNPTNYTSALSYIRNWSFN